MSSLHKPLLAACAALALGACASVPKPLEGSFTPVAPAQANTLGAAATVRWGGQIIKTKPGAQATCFFVLARPLDSIARPRAEADGDGGGRFVACHSGFYDPEVFAKGREVTFTGSVDGNMQRKVGQYQYTYPRLAANTVYLWPRRPRMTAWRDPFYDPFYDPFWGPAYGPWYNPYWSQPRVIVVRPLPHHHH